MTQQQIESFLALGLGFAVAGLITALYRAFRNQPMSFGLIFTQGASGFAAVPLLIMAGPAIIIRNTIRGRRYEKRKFHFVWMATVIASLWSLITGFFVMRLMQGSF